jgi:hypothetical protein
LKTTSQLIADVFQDQDQSWLRTHISWKAYKDLVNDAVIDIALREMLNGYVPFESRKASPEEQLEQGPTLEKVKKTKLSCRERRKCLQNIILISAKSSFAVAIYISILPSMDILVTKTKVLVALVSYVLQLSVRSFLRHLRSHDKLGFEYSR